MSSPVHQRTGLSKYLKALRDLCQRVIPAGSAGHSSGDKGSVNSHPENSNSALPVSILVRKGVRRTLFNMAFPMLAGTFAINAYNLTDAYFVARLGTPALAAMGFTLPVIMLLSCVAGGLGTGVTTLVSHALGRHDHAGAARVTTHGLALMLASNLGLMHAAYRFVRRGAAAEPD